MPTKSFPFLRVWPSLHLPIRRFSQRRAAIIPAVSRFGAAQWVLGRSLYRFSRFDLKHVSKAQRPQALRLLIQQWSPFAITGQYVLWASEVALVWAWDADRLSMDLAAQKLKLASTRIIPESLLHPPLNAGLRLVECLDGVEGQIWVAQRPIHSRWWVETPSSSDWVNFQRDAGIAPDLNVGIPVAQSLMWLKQPWAKSADLRKGDGQVWPYEAWCVRGAALVLMALTVWQSTELIKTRQAAGQLRTRLAEVAQSAQPVLEARRKALDGLARIETLQAINPYPTQLGMLAEVATKLPKNDTYLTEWDYQNGKLKITIVTPNKLSNSFLVKQLQDSGWFRNVLAVPSNGADTLTLTMDSLPQAEITSASRGAKAQGGAENIGNAPEPAKSSPKT